MKKIKVCAVIPSRNEQEYLEKTLVSLKNQTLKVEKIIVVDDGSTDETPRIAEKYADVTVNLQSHDESYAGKPDLARVINRGLLHVPEDADYVLILGADHQLPKNYVERIIERMERDPKLVIASGRIEGEPYSEDAPRGSGRIVKSRFWRNLNGMRYPVVWGWEAWLLYKAMQLGYRVKCFYDITSNVQKKTELKKAGLWGKAMYALGYDWKYVVGRSFLMFLKSPRAGFEMFINWLLHRDVERLEISEWVNNMQKEMFKRKLLKIIKCRLKR